MDENLRILAETYEDLQKLRIACSNRFHAYERDDLFIRLTKKFFDIEKEIQNQMKKYLQEHQVWPWLSQVKGIGPTLGCKLLSQIEDISKFDTVSKLWRYAGLAVIDGEAERKKKGEKVHFNPRLKTCMFLIGQAFLKGRSPYRIIYDEAKKYYTDNRDWTPKHIHNAALRKMEKIFLAHLWQKWREVEGLDTREEYVFEVLGHEHRYMPKDFIE